MPHYNYYQQNEEQFEVVAVLLLFQVHQHWLLFHSAADQEWNYLTWTRDSRTINLGVGLDPVPEQWIPDLKLWILVYITLFLEWFFKMIKKTKIKRLILLILEFKNEPDLFDHFAATSPFIVLRWVVWNFISKFTKRISRIPKVVKILKDPSGSDDFSSSFNHHLLWKSFWERLSNFYQRLDISLLTGIHGQLFLFFGL